MISESTLFSIGFWISLISAGLASLGLFFFSFFPEVKEATNQLAFWAIFNTILTIWNYKRLKGQS
jgi:hypothetical protein